MGSGWLRECLRCDELGFELVVDEVELVRAARVVLAPAGGGCESARSSTSNSVRRQDINANKHEETNAIHIPAVEVLRELCLRERRLVGVPGLRVCVTGGSSEAAGGSLGDSSAVDWAIGVGGRLV